MILFGFLVILLLPFLVAGGSLALCKRKKRRAILRWTGILYLAAAMLIIFGLGPYLLARLIVNSGTRPADRLLQNTPTEYQIHYEDVFFETPDHLKLSGWFLPPSGKNAIIVCAHGLFRNRIEVLGRIIPLARAGYGALIYDSRSHGSSGKAKVSLGYFERYDVLGASQYIRRRYQSSESQPKIVLMGVSMGAVAVMEAAAETGDYAAVILDSPFSSLRETVTHHAWLFLKMPRYPFPSLFLFWFQRLAGFDANRVNGHEALRRMQPVPLLIIASEGDERIKSNVARALYSEADSKGKEIHLFGKDVSHGAAARLHPGEYNDLLLDFLDRAIAMK
jgi:uncharacterized protein